MARKRQWSDKRVLRYITPVLAGSEVLVSLVVLVQWLSGFMQSVVSSLTWVPMAPLTAIFFFLIGAALLLQHRLREGRVLSGVIRTTSVLVLLGSSYLLLHNFVDMFSADIESILIPSTTSASGSIIGRMSPVTALLFILISISLFISTFQRERPGRLFVAADVLTSSVFVISLIILSGYWYKAPLFYGGTTIPMALPSAIGFLLVSTAQLFNKPENFFYRFVTSSSVTAKICRSILPLSILIVLTGGYAEEFVSGLIGPGMFPAAHVGLTLVVVIVIIIIVSTVSRGVEEDIIRKEIALTVSETRYRRLFEAAKDGVLIVNAETGLIVDVNPFLIDLVGFSKEDFLGKELWEIGIFKDIVANKVHFEELRRKGYMRYEDLPLKTADGRHVDVEFVSNVYEVDHQKVVQCNIRDITERKQMEDKLRESEEKFRNLITNAPIGIILTTASGNIIDVNKGLLEMHGYDSKEEFNKAPIADRYYDLKDREQWLKLVREQGKVEGFEVLLKRKDGTLFWASFSTMPQGTESGEQQFINVIQDITQRKRAEEKLVTAEQNFRNSLDDSPLAVIINKNMGQPVYANLAALKLFGFASLKEMKEAPLLQRQTPENMVRIQERWAKIKRGEFVSEHTEHDIIRTDGERRYVETFIKNILWDGEEHLQVIYQDITERKRAEETLRLQAELLDVESDSVDLHDFEGNFLYVNKSAYLTLGYTKEELLNMNISQLDDQESKDRTPARQKELSEKGKTTFNVNHRHKNGSWIPLEVYASLIEIGGKKWIMAVARDITERKKLQEQLMAQDRLASLGQLVSGVAHEINNPLTGVIGFSDLLLQRDLPEDVKYDLKIVNDEAKRTVNIVKNLLTFARSQTEGKTAVDLNEIIRRVLILRAHEQKINNIQVNTRFAADLPLITGNSSQLQQVFFNIVINAEQAMLEAHNRGTLIITTEPIGDMIRASIADDGPGISPENMGRLFTPFFTTKEVGRGTGLGLSICHGIITEHGGRIHAESGQGKGTTFIIELPVNKQ